ncbi:MAG: hypothetical protein PHX62_06495 [Bacilli bacterium]|nr:hypothetical protein [Bacilli bacterium]
MKIKQDFVSSQFYQVYFTFTPSEINQFYEEVMNVHGISEKEARKQQKYLEELVMEKIEEDVIEEELSRLEIVPICGRKFRYLTKLSRNHPLLVISQFCILPIDLQIKLPTKIPAEIFKISYASDVLKDFTRQILIQNGEYEYKDAEVSKKGSIVKYDIAYVRDDFIISEIEDQEINLDDVEQPDRSLFLNRRVGETLILDEDDSVTVKATIKEIRALTVNRLTNKIVSELKFLNTKTVSEFNEKIKAIFNFSSSVVILLNYLAEFVIQTGDIELDDYVLDFFLENANVPKSKKALDEYIAQIKKEVIKEYIIWVINLNYTDVDNVYMNKILEEYEFEKILFNNPMRIDGYQEFISRHSYEVRVLQYCIDNKIIDHINII